MEILYDILQVSSRGKDGFARVHDFFWNQTGSEDSSEFQDGATLPSQVAK
jgi:hypothetical protein